MVKKYRKNSNMLLLLILLLLSITLGYATLSSNINITGVSKIKNVTWNIYWNNIQVTDGSVTNVTTPATIKPGKLEVEFDISFSTPGDFYEFTVDAVNDGTIDAMLDNFNLTINNNPSTTLPDYLEYKVTYVDDSTMEINHILYAEEKETYKVRVSYKKDIEAEQLPQEAQTFNFCILTNYIQVSKESLPTKAIFLDGNNFNTKIKKLAGDENPAINTDNESIIAIRRSTIKPNISSMNRDNIISTANSGRIYAWFEDGTIYFYSEYSEVYINPDASGMFQNLLYTEVIELNKMNSSLMENMSCMFLYTSSEIDSVDLIGIENLNVSNVTNMEATFADFGMSISNFSLDLSSWDVSKVQNMSMTFTGTAIDSSTFNLDISNWDTRNVTDMIGMFLRTAEDAVWLNPITIDIYNSKIDNMFNDTFSVKAILNLYNNPISYGGIFSNYAASRNDGFVQINYKETVTEIDNIVAKKLPGCNITKGNIIP